jgi:hypothetical protein
MSFTGEQHKFESYEAAMTYIKERDYGNTLKYWGWEGQLEGYYVYTFITGGVKYHLAIYKNGKVEIRE